MTSRGLSSRLLEDLGPRIVLAEISEGSSLDVSNLESLFGVSRTVVREALKVLADKGLIDARPRIGTSVLPRRHWNLFDADVMRWRSSRGMAPSLAAELNELRHMVEPWAAGVAAARRTDVDLMAISDGLDAMREAYVDHGATGANTTAAHVAGDVAFHLAILVATQNELVRRLDVMLTPILQVRDTVVSEVDQDAQFLDAHEEVFRAIQAGDEARARRAMASLLDAAAADLDRTVKPPGDVLRSEVHPKASRSRLASAG